MSGSRLTSAAVLGNVDFGRLAPNSYLRRDPHRIGKFPCFQRIPELGRITVARIRHYDSVRQTPTADLVDHLQSQLPLLLKLDFLWDARFRPTFLISDPAFRQNNRQFSAALPCAPTWCKLTATWQLPVFPKVPEYCRSTPTE